MTSHEIVLLAPNTQPAFVHRFPAGCNASSSPETQLWIDVEQGLIIIDAASSRKAEDALALLRKSLGSLPVIPLTMETPVELTLTEWVRSGALAKGFSLREEATLKGILQGSGVINCKEQELTGDEVATNIEAGKLVTALGLEWRGKISFVLNDAGGLKKLKFSDVMAEQNADLDPEDVQQRFDADFVLYTSELRRLIKELIAGLGGEAKQKDIDFMPAGETDDDSEDLLYERAVAHICEVGQVSISRLQRHLRIGYNRAAHLIERMEADKIVSPPSSSGTRSIIGGL